MGLIVTVVYEVNDTTCTDRIAFEEDDASIQSWPDGRLLVKNGPSGPRYTMQYTKAWRVEVISKARP